jgi:dihydroxyacid dehydratase/phosphogluconate dehydratase
MRRLAQGGGCIHTSMEEKMSSESVPKFLAVDKEPIDRRSRVFLEKFEHPAARGQLAGAGLTREHYGKAQVAIVHNGFDQNTCNMHLDESAKVVQAGVDKSPMLKGWKFPVGGISDGITMGLPGMRASLLSREWIADAVEGHVYAHPYDALIAIPGCDKNMPGVVMAMARLNIPLRKQEWKAPEPKYDRGLFFKATRDMAQANLGAVSDMPV